MNLYVRIRGRVHGPLPMAKLQELVGKGQLNRIHEVSENAQVWRPASSVPELFDAIQPNQAVSAFAESQRAAPSGPVLSAIKTTRGEPAQLMWHYAINGNQHGPVPQKHLIDLLHNGNLKPSDLVWRSGMEQWVEVQNMPALFSGTQSKADSAVLVSATAASPSNPSGVTFPQAVIAENIANANIQPAPDTRERVALIQSLTDSMPWINGAMIASFFVAIAVGLASIATLLFGVVGGQPGTAFIGLLTGILCGFLGWMAVSLNRSHKSIEVASQVQTDGAIAEALVDLRAMGRIYLGILVIALTMLVVLGIGAAIGVFAE